MKVLKKPESEENQSVELDKLVMLKRLLRRRGALPESLILNGLRSEVSRKLARALADEQKKSALDERENRYLRQVEKLA